MANKYAECKFKSHEIENSFIELLIGIDLHEDASKEQSDELDISVLEINFMLFNEMKRCMRENKIEFKANNRIPYGAYVLHAKMSFIVDKKLVEAFLLCYGARYAKHENVEITSTYILKLFIDGNEMKKISGCLM